MHLLWIGTFVQVNEDTEIKRKPQNNQRLLAFTPAMWLLQFLEINDYFLLYA